VYSSYSKPSTYCKVKHFFAVAFVYSTQSMKISELAKQTGVSTTTIRHYEAEGLLAPPNRADNNYRAYGKAHVGDLVFIRNCRELDMTFEEIRALLALRARRDVDCSAANALLDEHIGHIDTELAKLKQIRSELQTLRSLCTQASPSADCEILNGIATLESMPPDQGSEMAIRKRHGV
jgi:Cd(II)/Pb(II)-responsive transcriptional regulator